MRKNKIKKILMISLVTLLAIGTLGVSLAFFGRHDYNKAKDAFKDAFVKEETLVGTRNVLLNSNFQLSSSGVTTFTSDTSGTSGSSFMDNWKNGHVGNPTFEMNIVNDGLHVVVDSDSAETLYITQNLVDRSADLLGNVVTISFSLDDVVYSESFEILKSEESKWYEVSSGKLAIAMVQSSVDMFYFHVKCQKGFEGTINWVQLELGNVFTGYVAPTTEAVA